MRQIRSTKSVSAVLPVFVVAALVLMFIAGYYIAVVLPASLPTTLSSTKVSYTSTLTGNLTSNVSYQLIRSQTPKTVYIYIVPGASIARVPAFNPSPAKLVIGVNNTVIWKNEDSVVQNVVALNGLFKSTNMTALTGTYTFTFNQTGIYDYASTIYPFENGTIIVVSG